MVDALQEQFGERAIRRGLWVEQELKEKEKKSEKTVSPPYYEIAPVGVR